MRVAIYIRVSTKLQEDKYSLNAQTTELTRYANAQNWTIVDIFKDVDSGTKLNKDGLEAMLDAAAEGKIDVVLCIEQDRLSRLDTIKWEYLKRTLREHQVKIAEPGQMVDLTNEDDEFISDLKNLLAQRSRRDLLRKMMRGKRQRTREGKVWGKQPEEYIYDTQTETLSINPERSWIIPYIDDLYLNHQLGVSAIARRLNQFSKTIENKVWTSQQVLNKLKNPAYHGVLQKTFSNGETITVPDIYPALRTEEQFLQIQRKLSKGFTPSIAEPHPLRSTVIHCAACNKRLSIKKSYTYNTDKTKRYPNFYLMHLNEQTKKNCPVDPNIHLKRILHNLTKLTKDILFNPKNLLKYSQSTLDETELSSLKLEIQQLERSLAKRHEQIDKLIDLYLDNTWSKQRLNQHRSVLEKEIEEFELQLTEKRRRYAIIQEEQFNFNAVIELFSVSYRYEQLLNVEEQQKLIGALFPEAILSSNLQTLTLKTKLPNELSIELQLQVETMEDVIERELYDTAIKRYNEAQEFLYRHPYLSLYELSERLNYSPLTLKKDQKQFGPFQYLKVPTPQNKLYNERKKLIQKHLKQNPRLSGRQLEQITGINRKAIYQIIKKEGLR